MNCNICHTNEVYLDLLPLREIFYYRSFCFECLCHYYIFYHKYNETEYFYKMYEYYYKLLVEKYNTKSESKENIKNLDIL